MSYLNPIDRSEVKARLPSLRRVVVWGKTARDESRWARIQAGDIAVFYHYWTYFELAQVVWKARNPLVARKLWREDAYDSQGRLGEMLIFYKPLKQIKIPHSRLHRALGWSDYPLRRFQVKRAPEANRAITLLSR